MLLLDELHVCVISIVQSQDEPEVGGSLQTEISDVAAAKVQPRVSKGQRVFAAELHGRCTATLWIVQASRVIGSVTLYDRERGPIFMHQNPQRADARLQTSVLLNPEPRPFPARAQYNPI